MNGIDSLQVQTLAAILFVLGVAITLTRRNIFFFLMGVELMLNAVNLSFVGFSRQLGGQASLVGHVAPLFIVAVAAAEACVGLAMVMCIVRSQDSIDSDSYASMKE